MALLARRFEHRVTVIEGAAGFGKTTLLAQALRENALAPWGRDVWLTLEPDDEIPEVLGAALCEAIGVRGGTPGAPRVVVDAITDALWQESPKQVALLLDDAHEVSRESPGAEVLGQLLAAMPANAHLVLATRKARPVPTARLLARGEVLEIGEQALAFTEEEVEAFASLRDVAADSLAATGGWPALAELAAATGDNRGLDFVAEEVLGALTPARRRVVATLAVLGGGDEEVAAAATGTEVDLDAALDGVPLVVHGANGWRSLHPLWRDALDGELDDHDSGLVCRRAAEVLARRGDASAAFRLLAVAGAWDEARGVMRDACSITHPPVPTEVMARWLRALPAAMREEPETLLVQGVVAKISDRRRARDTLERAAESFRARGDHDGEMAALVQLGHMAIWRDDGDTLRSVVLRGFELERAGVEAARPIASIARAVAAQMSGEDRDALDELDRVDTSRLNEEWVAVVEFYRSVSLLFLGFPDAAAEHAVASCRLSGPSFRPLPDLPRLLAGCATGDLDALLGELRELVSTYEDVGLTRNLLGLCMQLSLAESCAGDCAQARSHLARVRALAGDQEGPWVPLVSALAEAAFAVAEGDDDRAEALLHSELEARPLQDPAHARHHRPWLALSYVLVPATRGFWDEEPLSEWLTETRRLARALVEVREHEEAARALVWPRDELRSHLPVAWLTELAVTCIAAGDDAGRDVLERVGPAARPVLRRLRTAGRPAVADAARQLLAEIPAAPAHELELCVLGPVELRRDGVLVDDRDWRRERVRSLLLYLVANPESTREGVADALWPEADAETSGRNLRVNLAYLQRVLEPSREEREPPFFLRQQGTMFMLVVDERLRLDVREFERLLDAAAAAERDGVPSLALDRYRAALELYRGEYLANAPWSDWTAPERDRLRARFVAGAVRAGELLVASGQTVEAVALATRAVEAEPWSEAARRLVIAAHLAEGDRPAARRAMAQCHTMLAELAVDPEPETVVLERRLGGSTAT